jgi:hypothetical protein
MIVFICFVALAAIVGGIAGEAEKRGNEALFYIFCTIALFLGALSIHYGLIALVELKGAL